MEEENNNVTYKLEEVDGKTVKNIYIGADFAFSLSEDFPESHIMEVFQLADKLFGDGVQYGITRTKEAIKQAIGSF